MGAGYHNGFALNLPSVTADQIASATVHLNGVEVGHTVIHDDGNQTILTIDPDLSDKLTQEGLIDQVCPYYRTEADCLASQPENGMEYSLSVTFNTPINRTDIGYPPYDPFIFSADHIYHGDYYPTPPGIGWQTHLKQFSGTSEFDSSLFGNYEDGSAGTNFFVSGNAMPWAINITDVWDHPSEYKDISTAYPMFASWVTSSGRLNSDWYKSSRANAQFVFPYAQEN
jgi:LruC domain-containing protein